MQPTFDMLCLTCPCHHRNDHATGFDVNKDEHFSNSRRIFSAVLAETKRKGLGVITHKPPIAPEDLQKLYEPTHGTFSVENF